METCRDIEPEVLSCDIGGASIQYLHYPSEGPTLILLHATGFLAWLWHPIARRLKGRFRIIAPSFCDHRCAEPEEGGVNWALLADDLRLLCNALGVSSAYLAGHSMGGTVITIAAASGGVRPERMMLIEPIFLPQWIYRTGVTVEQHPLASRSIRRRSAWSGVDEARIYLRSKPLFAKWDDEMLELYLKYGMVSSDAGGIHLACHPRREAALFMGGLQFDPWPLLPSIECPVMVLEGETSENRTFIDYRAIATLFPKGEYRLVEQAGHLIPQEKPDLVASLMNDFFSEGAASSR